MTTYLGKSCSFCLPRVPFVNCRQFVYLVISLLVLRAGYGIWLYQFLIVAYLFTLVKKTFLRPFSLFRWFKKSSCQLLAKECALSTGKLPIYFSWFGPELFCLLLGPPGFNCWFSSAPVFRWCCSATRGSPGVGRNTFLSSLHLCFIIVFVCDLFVSRDDPLMRENLHADRTTVCFEPW